jgi:hypothetical protein
MQRNLQATTGQPRRDPIDRRLNIGRFIIAAIIIRRTHKILLFNKISNPSQLWVANPVRIRFFNVAWEDLHAFKSAKCVGGPRCHSDQRTVTPVSTEPVVRSERRRTDSRCFVRHATIGEPRSDRNFYLFLTLTCRQQPLTACSSVPDAIGSRSARLRNTWPSLRR